MLPFARRALHLSGSSIPPRYDAHLDADGAGRRARACPRPRDRGRRLPARSRSPSKSFSLASAPSYGERAFIALTPSRCATWRSISPSRRVIRDGAKRRSLVDASREWSLLEALVRSGGSSRFRERVILSRVWDDEGRTGSNTVDVYINQLRRKIDGDTAQKTDPYGAWSRIRPAPSADNANRRGIAMTVRLRLTLWNVAGLRHRHGLPWEFSFASHVKQNLEAGIDRTSRESVTRRFRERRRGERRWIASRRKKSTKREDIANGKKAFQRRADRDSRVPFRSSPSRERTLVIRPRVSPRSDPGSPFVRCISTGKSRSHATVGETRMLHLSSCPPKVGPLAWQSTESLAADEPGGRAVHPLAS